MRRVRNRWALLCVIALGAVFTQTAAAHLPGHRMCSNKMAAKIELKCGKRSYYHGLGASTAIRVLLRRTQQSSSTQEVAALRITLSDHLWLMRAGRKWITEARHRLIPPAPRIAHEALWKCITNGAYPGAAHEGNGYNGSYSGPLGMTTPWGGHMPTGSDWVHTPVETVYADAEAEYAKSGYSTLWLHGQWPNTSPPCAGFQ